MFQRKRIFFITTSPILSGAEKYLFLLVKEIKKEYDCFVIVLQSPTEHDDLFSCCEKENIPIFSLHLDSKIHFWKVFRLRRIIKKYQPDILISMLFFDSIVASFFGKLLNIPVIMSIQHADPFQKRWRTWIERIIVQRVKIMFSNSQAGKAWFSQNTRFPLERIHIVSNPFDLTRLNHQNPLMVQKIRDWHKHHKGFKIVTVGRLEKVKDHISLIQAIESLHNQGVQISLSILGSGSLYHDLQAYIAQHNLSAYVHLWGYVENAQSYIKEFDLFVLSSISEGMPNVLIEAMAQEVLWCSTDVGSVRELCPGFEDLCIISHVQKIQAIQSAILRFYNLSDEVKQKMKEQMKARVLQEFSPQTVAGQFYHVIRTFDSL